MKNVTIELNDKEMNKRIGRYAARISGKATPKKVFDMLQVVYKGDELPTQEYLKAYLKEYNF